MSPGAVFFQRNPWFICRWLLESAGSSTHSQENWQSQCLLPQQGCALWAGMDHSAFSETPCSERALVLGSMLGWVVGRRKTCEKHCSPWWEFVLQRHCDTAGQHPQASQDGCDYFWDGFSVLRNTICPIQAAASMLMLLPSNRDGWIEQGSSWSPSFPGEGKVGQ